MKPRLFFILFILLAAMGMQTACQRNYTLAPLPIPTSTFTPVFTSTPSFTFTPTFTFTPIFTQTSSFTETTSFTFTSTFTFSVTPTPTNSSTPTNSPTATGVPGLDWFESPSQPPFPGRYFHSSVVYNNLMWVIAGLGSQPLTDVWSSSNGVTWTQATAAAAFGARFGHTSVVFGAPASMLVIGGNTGMGTFLSDVWSSSDGANWNPVTTAAGFSARYGHTAVVYNGMIWVIGGYDGTTPFDNDVWSSPDGATWTQVLANGPGGATQFTGRAGHTCLVYNGQMWVIGGFDSTYSFKNDVWSSPDGITWTQVNAAALFPAREDHTSLVYNGAMWVIAGQTNSALLNDVWTSTDGNTWTPVATTSTFATRSYHSSLVFNPGTSLEMWVIAGYTSGGPSYDVWHSP